MNRSTVQLENDIATVIFDAERPILLQYRFNETGAELLGDCLLTGPEFLIYRGMEPFRNDNMDIVYSLIESTTSFCQYRAEIAVEGEAAVSLDFSFELEGDKMIVGYDQVKEQSGYFFMQTTLRTLALSADDSGAYMILPCDLGRSIQLESTSVQTVEMELNWKNTHLCAMLHTRNAMGLLECEAYEDRLVSSVVETADGKYGSLGVIFMHRLHQFELIEYGQQLPVEEPDYFLHVQQRSKAAVSLLSETAQGAGITWMDGAERIRNRIETRPLPYYEDKWITKLALDISPNVEKMTFDEALDYIRRIHAATSGQAVVLYLVGWQYSGHDTGYPSVAVVNEGLGGEAALKRLIAEARRYNVLISFHDNYDDAYKESDAWDADVVSRDSQGNLMRCGYFTYGQAYLLNNLKYARKYGIDRVQETVRRHDIQHSYHIDVLSGAYKCGRRYDFNPSSPMTAREGMEGKRMIISAFNELDVDVTTEDFSALMVGPIRHFWSMNFAGDTYYSNEERIPLIPYMYHGKVSYGMNMNKQSQYGILRGLLYGATFSMDMNRDNFREQIEHYYLAVLPWMQLYWKKMIHFEISGDVETVTYEDGSYVTINTADRSYTVSIQDRVIGCNYTSFVPVTDRKILVYSQQGADICEALPPEWDAAEQVTVCELREDGEMRGITSSITDKRLVFRAEAGIPYSVTNAFDS